MACKESVQIINSGIGGETSTNLLYRINEDVIIRQPDLVLLMVGTNDMLNTQDPVPFDTYKSNLSEMVQELRQNQIEVVLISPIPVDTTCLFKRFSREVFSGPPNEKLDSVRYILRQLADDQKVEFIDLFGEFRGKELTILAHDNQHDCEFNDGVHPTAGGYELIAQSIFNYLVSHKLIENDMKIVCFGDSITMGWEVEGQGTATGETYPAKLKRLILDYLK